ncbi:MAG: site-2 protease family protein [Clostridia bacterium]|nr:site-2 protease family protein [Clostridia bacterium]
MLSLDPVSLLVTLPIILLSLAFHEFSHAYVAVQLGDRTPKWAGRLTLNPLAHLDPVGTIVLVITGRYGWAKPVPINPGNFRDRDAGTVMVSLAGPLSNLVLAVALGLVFKAVYGPGLGLSDRALFVLTAINEGVWINLGLAAFNLLPVPPLDGSKIVASLVRGRAAQIYYQLEQYSYMILLLIVATPLARWILGPIILTLYRAIM